MRLPPAAFHIRRIESVIRPAEFCVGVEHHPFRYHTMISLGYALASVALVAGLDKARSEIERTFVSPPPPWSRLLHGLVEGSAL